MQAGILPSVLRPAGFDRAKGSWLALIGAVAALLPCVARAQSDCDTQQEPGPCWVFPRPGTPEAVTLDAPIEIRYTPKFFDTYGRQATAIDVFDSATGNPVPGVVEVAASDLMFFLPNGGWQPTTSYDGRVYGQGMEIDFNFTTGTTVDRSPPIAGRILDVTPHPGSEVAAVGPGSERVDIDFQSATDDGPIGSIEYQIYLTRGHGIDAPVLRLRKLGQEPGAPIPAAIGLTAYEAEQPACVAVVAVDGVGKTDVSNEDCFDPVVGSFFQPLCSAGGTPHLPGVLGLVMPIGLVLWVRRRRAPKVSFRSGRVIH